MNDDNANNAPETSTQTPPKRKRGRPRKSEVAAKTPGKRGKVGRPKGDAAIINEYKARMLASPKSTRVLEKLFDAALDDDHKHQAAAWKLIVDRMLPVSAFETDVQRSGGKNAIQINISGIGGGVNVSGSESENDGDIIDGDVVNVSETEYNDDTEDAQ